MDTRKLVVPPQAGQKRLDIILLGLLGEDFSRSQVQRLIQQGLVTINDEPVRAAQKVHSGDIVAVVIPDPEPLDLIPEPMDLDILFEDEHLLVINKPAGLVVHPAPGHSTGTLVNALMHHCGSLAEVGGKQRPGIVHRLDKDTSGAIIVAKSDQAHRSLVVAFAAGRIKKEYLALVVGNPPAEGQNTNGIGRHPIDRKRMSTSARNLKTAKTSWRVVRRFEAGYSLLRVRIKTGRTHQIRVHMQESGFPVAGDPVYGVKKRQKGEISSCIVSLGRQLLHALTLNFKHPVTGETMEVTAPLPEDFRSILRLLERRDNA